jgi:uncharacterized membrane protein (UPF0127 family)
MKYLFLLIVVSIAGCVSSQPYVEIAGGRVYVEIADEPAEWSRGLMFVENMPQDKGMLFVFPDDAQRSFWMKNTLIPLDMIFIDSQGIVTNVTRNAQPCMAILCKSYYGKAKYVLEINGNASNVRIGDKIAMKIA